MSRAIALASAETVRLRDIVIEGSQIDLRRFSDALHVTARELASAAGISSEAARRPERAATSASQRGLRDLMEVIDRVTPWAGSTLQAFAWYRSEPIPAFGQMTPEQIVKEGHADALRDYLDGISIGGYA